MTKYGYTVKGKKPRFTRGITTDGDVYYADGDGAVLLFEDRLMLFKDGKWTAYVNRKRVIDVLERIQKTLFNFGEFDEFRREINGLTRDL